MVVSFYFSFKPMSERKWATVCGEVALAAYNQPLEPVPVETRMPLDLNFPS